MTVVTDLQSCAQSLVDAARELYQRGWMEGTAGNLSLRLPGTADAALITASGRSKGQMTVGDMVPIHVRTGAPVDPNGARPSAEAVIHAALLRVFGDCNGVVHAHPPYATIAAARATRASTHPHVRIVEFRDFELIKGLQVDDPSRVTVPVFRNWPDVARIARDIEEHFDDCEPERPWVLLIAHHGATAWGSTLDGARNALECLEALCRLKLLSAMAALTEERS